MTRRPVNIEETTRWNNCDRLRRPFVGSVIPSGYIYRVIPWPFRRKLAPVRPLSSPHRLATITDGVAGWRTGPQRRQPSTRVPWDPCCGHHTEASSRPAEFTRFARPYSRRSRLSARLPGPPSGTCHPRARTSIPSSSASRSSRLSFAPHAVAAARRSGRSSVSVSSISALTNAATIFGTAGTRSPHGHEKRRSQGEPGPPASKRGAHGRRYTPSLNDAQKSDSGSLVRIPPNAGPGPGTQRRTRAVVAALEQTILENRR